jgi:hypothetical protein
MVGGQVIAPSDSVAASTVFVLAQGNGYSFTCSGVIVANDAVLTAAHCLDLVSSQGVAVGIAFTTNVYGSGYRVTKVPIFKQHENYVPHRHFAGGSSDIAILNFDGGLPEGYKPVRLWNDARIPTNARTLVAGYGVQDENKVSETAGVLKKGGSSLAVRDLNATESEMGVNPSFSPVEGDSGGPLYIERAGELFLFGLVSRGDCVYLCNGADRLGTIFTRVAAFRQWVGDGIKEMRQKRGIWAIGDDNQAHCYIEGAGGRFVGPDLCEIRPSFAPVSGLLGIWAIGADGVPHCYAEGLDADPVSPTLCKQHPSPFFGNGVNGVWVTEVNGAKRCYVEGAAADPVDSKLCERTRASRSEN